MFIRERYFYQAISGWLRQWRSVWERTVLLVLGRWLPMPEMQLPQLLQASLESWIPEQLLSLPNQNHSQVSHCVAWLQGFRGRGPGACWSYGWLRLFYAYPMFDLFSLWTFSSVALSKWVPDQGLHYINQAEHQNGTLPIQKSIGLQMNRSN